MPMTPSIRKFALTAHVTTSVGWLGAVAGFLALALAGLRSQNALTVRAAYLAMELTGWFVIVPLSLASLTTGLFQSLGGAWGLFRHYWVVAKLLITTVASAILLLHMQPITFMAGLAADRPFVGSDLNGLRTQLVADAVVAIIALLAATALSVYKPWGMTAYGRRKQQGYSSGRWADNIQKGGHTAQATTDRPRWHYVAGIVVIATVVLFLFKHLTGGGLGRH